MNMFVSLPLPLDGINSEEEPITGEPGHGTT